LRALGGNHAQQQRGHQQARGVERGGRHQQPGEHGALVEERQGARSPADEQQQRDGDEPVAEDIAHSRACIAVIRPRAGKGEREGDDRKNQVGALERHAEHRCRNQKCGNDDGRVDQRVRQRRGRELMVEEAALRLICCQHDESQIRRRANANR